MDESREVDVDVMEDPSIAIIDDATPEISIEVDSSLNLGDALINVADVSIIQNASGISVTNMSHAETPEVSMESEGLQFMIQPEPVYEVVPEAVSLLQQAPAAAQTSSGQIKPVAP